ncbi:MAG: adenylosuccinate synthase [Chitinivibrionales bacterium]|nr:adenylosuccinate synthase [Chitinivibrionales bacterium]MBD3357065.1 adenylosuccinate synthase [Chitinivibrionales bacterium]
MANLIVIGAQWGDEGKAKTIDYLTERSDVVIRFQGGANAGHTVIVDSQKFVFHMVPSGIMYPDKSCIIGNGVVFDAEQFLREVDELTEKGFSVEGRLFVSDQAHMVLPYHKALDQAAESRKSGVTIGTTGRGIGPAYADKAARTGIRVGDLRDWDAFEAKIAAAYSQKKDTIEKVYGGTLKMEPAPILEQYKTIKDRILAFVTDTSHFAFEASRAGKRLLFEGAQGTLLDIDHGTYPFVTSSNTIAGAACTGAGIGPCAIDHAVGIVKTYTTRVGNGPFPTEQDNAMGERLRKEGGEFGATTGRPRRCGWFDSVIVRKAVQTSGLTRLALTKLDVLNTFEEIKVCTHYEIDGKRIDQFPSHISLLEKVVPVYESLPGWERDLSGCRTIDDLPENARKYVRRLQELCYNVPILLVSVGPERRQTIEVDPV